jgi:hypothetical protein
MWFSGSRDLTAGPRKTSFTATDIDARAKQLLGALIAAAKS